MFYMTELSPNALEEHENITLNAKTGDVKSPTNSLVKCLTAEFSLKVLFFHLFASFKVSIHSFFGHIFM